MNCQHAQKEMQKALDRRLPPSEQRAHQEHILACKPCRMEFDQYKKLQGWTRELPTATLSSDFSQNLFRRIQSGEGSPEGILLEPVPITRKLRIFVSGAVTAAALLLGAFLIFETLGDNKDTGSINFMPTQPSPISVADPVKRAELALSDGVFTYEAARGLQGVSQPNRRTLDNIVVRGQSIESSMATLERLFQKGEILLALEDTQGVRFRMHVGRLMTQAKIMQMAPQMWLQQQIEERKQGSSATIFLVEIGQGFDPSTNTLRHSVIIRGKPQQAPR